MTPFYGFYQVSCRIVLLLTCVFMSMESIHAQPVSSNRGRDFSFSFLPNFHSLANDTTISTANKFRDSLYIYVACDVPTQGTITATNRFGTSIQIPFQIADPTQIYTYATPWQGYELEGWNHHGAPASNSVNQCQRIALQHFRVVAADEITVYALNQADRTSDAFLVLPTSALGLEYLVMSYPSDGYMNNGANSTTIHNASTPSEFAVTAISDSTKVLIYPTSPTYRYGLKPDTVLLMQGQSYLVQSSITPTNLRGDLTGSRVVADKPVAVFGGHQRALLPVELRGDISSRDCIIEQMPPLSAWGKSAFLAPYPQAPGITQLGSDKFRVLAAFDSTDIFLGGTPLRTLSAGQFYTSDLLSTEYLTASKPILVAQYKKTSSGNSQGNGNVIADPFMMIIPPKEQFLLSYRFINAQATQSNRPLPPTPMFTAQYVMIVAPTTALNTVRLDGNLVGAGAFQPIPTSNYMLATLRVGDGTHSLIASEPIGIYVFGYGLVNSYGYVGGMSFIEFDYQEPEITSLDTCFGVRGVAFDIHRTDSRLGRVESPFPSQKNIIVSVDSFKRYSDSVHFSGTLSDIYQDGEFAIIAEDSAGFTTEQQYSIPGFTVSASDSVTGQDSIAITTDGPIDHQYCFPVKLYNYGKFPQTITSASFQNTTRFSIQTPLPLTIQPQSNIELTVCFYDKINGIYKDILTIENACAGRNVASITVSAKPDTIAPRIIRAEKPCPIPIDLLIRESLPTDLGIKSIELIDSLTINCTVTQSIDTGYQSSRMEISPTNPDEDAFYAVKVTDAVGNVSFYRDTIPGFTLRFSIYENNMITHMDYGEIPIGEIVCREVTIENYGQFPLDFGLPFLVNNMRVSMPQSQKFPIILQPYSEQILTLCVAPIVAGLNVYDTLLFTFGCRIRPLSLFGYGKEVINEGPSRCDVPIRAVSMIMPASYGQGFLSQNQPNPLVVSSTIQFGFSRSTQATLTLYDALGTRRLLLADGQFTAGLYEVNINAENLENGMYYYELLTPHSKITKQMMIIR
ncbi:MAG: T9SS type A sorting domain-containing protein [Ignavibacteria bacterium]|nr:T9SS type A sorting domain-containing protein [Ignavibacteria bacterium]